MFIILASIPLRLLPEIKSTQFHLLTVFAKKIAEKTFKFLRAFDIKQAVGFDMSPPKLVKMAASAVSATVKCSK